MTEVNWNTETVTLDIAQTMRERALEDEIWERGGWKIAVDS